MKATKLNGEVVEFNIGKALCGVGFRSFTITEADIKLHGYEEVLRYIGHNLLNRLCYNMGDK